MRAVFLTLCGLGILVAFALACMGCDASTQASAPDLITFPESMPPGSPCIYTGTCADGQCAPSAWSPAGAFFNVGCCVRGNECRNAGEQAVCAFRIDYPNDGGTGRCIDCGDGRGLRCW